MKIIPSYRNNLLTLARNIFLLLLGLILLDIFTSFNIGSYINMVFIVILTVLTGLFLLHAFIKDKYFYIKLKQALMRTINYFRNIKSMNEPLTTKDQKNEISLKIMLTRGITKDNWHIWALCTIIISGLILRIWSAVVLAPAGDEFRHLIAAKRYLIEGFFEYPDTTATWIVIFVKKILNTSSLFLFRFPFILLSVISTILIYKIMKPFNKNIGLIAAYLFAFCPLAIGLGSYIRNYELISFMFIFGIFIIFERFISWKKRNTYLLVFLVLVLGFLSSEFNRSEQLWFILLIILGSYIFSELLNKYVKKAWLNSIVKVIAFAIAILVVHHLIPIFTHYSFHAANFEYLFFINYLNVSQTWFYSFIPFWILFLVLLISVLVHCKNSKIYSITLSTAIFSYFLIYFLDAPRVFQARYAYLVLILAVFLYSSGIMILYEILKKYLKTPLFKYVCFVLFFLIFLLLRA